MMDGVYSLVSDGITVVAVAGRPQSAKTTDGFETTATPLQIKEVLAGEPIPQEITLLAGVAELQLVEGRRYLLVLSAATVSAEPGAYTVGSTTSLLDEAEDGTWVSRDKSVTVTLDEMRAVLAKSEEHLAGRRRAGEAKLDLQVDPVDDRFRATVSGYARGDSLGIRFCHASDDPAVAPTVQTCDALLSENVTPEGATQTFDFIPPTEIRLSPEQSTPCDGDCVVVVYDLDFPAKVFATAPI